MSARSDRGDVAVIGGGIIGLSVAFELARRGASVRVYDCAQPARAASWAAAGMLAPQTEELRDSALHALCEASLAAYPAFVEAIVEGSGVDPHLRLDGILQAAYTPQRLEQLECRHDELRAAGVAAEVLSREQTLLAEPAVGRHVCGSLLIPSEGQIDNRRLGRALTAACEASGVRLQTGVSALRVECDARRVLGVRSDLGYHAVSAVVNAAGAWAAGIEGVPAHCVPEVRPVKGQMLALAIPQGFMRRTTWVPGAYLVPRSDGRLLIGATSEEAGFDTRVTAGGLDRLLHAAVTAVPSLAEFSVTESWAGLRPASPDERPYLGPTPLGGYYLATGHYRNGILLAPATARLLAEAIEGEAGGCAEFSLQRPGTKRASA